MGTQEEEHTGGRNDIEKWLKKKKSRDLIISLKFLKSLDWKEDFRTFSM